MVCAILPVTLSQSHASMIHLQEIGDSGPSSLTLEVTITPEVRRAILARLQDGPGSHKRKTEVRDINFSAPADGPWKMSTMDSEALSLRVQLPAQFLVQDKCEERDAFDGLQNDPDLKPLLQRVAMLERQLADKGVEPQTPEKQIENVPKPQEMKVQVVSKVNKSNQQDMQTQQKGPGHKAHGREVQEQAGTPQQKQKEVDHENKVGVQVSPRPHKGEPGDEQVRSHAGGVFGFYKTQTEQQRQQQWQMEMQHQERLRELQKNSSGIHAFYTPRPEDGITSVNEDRDKGDSEEAPAPNIFKFFDNQVNSENLRDRARRNKELQDQIQQQFNSLSNIAGRFFGKKNDGPEDDRKEPKDFVEKADWLQQTEPVHTQPNGSSSGINGNRATKPPEVPVQTQPNASSSGMNGTSGYRATKPPEVPVQTNGNHQQDVEKAKQELPKQEQSTQEGIQQPDQELEKTKQEVLGQDASSQGGISAFYAKKQNSSDQEEGQPSQQIQQIQQLLNVSSVLSFFGHKSSSVSADGNTSGSCAHVSSASAVESTGPTTQTDSAAPLDAAPSSVCKADSSNVAATAQPTQEKQLKEPEQQTVSNGNGNEELRKEVQQRMDHKLQKKQLALDDDLTAAPKSLFKCIESKDIVQSLAIVEDPEFTDINAVDSSGKTALHLAIIYGLGEVAVKIINRSDFTQINCSDCDGWTPLHCAAGWDRSAMIKGILERPDFTEIKGKDRWRRTALDVAAAQGNARACAALCGHPAFADEPDPAEQQLSNPLSSLPSGEGGADLPSRIRNCTPPTWASCGSRTVPPAT